MMYSVLSGAQFGKIDDIFRTLGARDVGKNILAHRRVLKVNLPAELDFVVSIEGAQGVLPAPPPADRLRQT